MLTRLEVDGFKNLLGFAADFGPYTCIAGPNAVGKSNIFDAIQFLSLLADKTFAKAAAGVRLAGGGPADSSLLFFNDPEQGSPRRIRLAAEMIVPREVEDDFGRREEVATSYLRYEIELEHGDAAARSGGIRLLHESLIGLRTTDAERRMSWLRMNDAFREAVIADDMRDDVFIETRRSADNEPVVTVHDKSQGPAAGAPRTFASTMTSAEFPVILAARNEMRRWRELSLEPSVMRQPDDASGPDIVSASGAHLPAALLRMAGADSGMYSRIAADVAALTDIRKVDVDVDEGRALLTLRAGSGQGPMMPARSLSDGTLRFLALCIIHADPEFDGVICMEEPENGIHPSRIQEMVELVRDIAVDPGWAPGLENPLRQVIVNTHSPHFVRKQYDDDLVLALPSLVRRGSRQATTLALHPMRGTWRTETDYERPALAAADVQAYLTADPGDQLVHDLGIEEERPDGAG